MYNVICIVNIAIYLIFQIVCAPIGEGSRAKVASLLGDWWHQQYNNNLNHSKVTCIPTTDGTGGIRTRLLQDQRHK